MRMTLEKTRIERERIEAGLRAFGCEIFPSVGNYIAAKTSKPAPDVVRMLQEDHGIMIGRLMVPGYEDYMRTTGRADDTDALLAALPSVLGRQDR